MKCVYLTDSKIPYEQAKNHFKLAADWARDQCQSFIGYHVQDVSDVSLSYDFVAEYRFTDLKDVVWFKLKFN